MHRSHASARDGRAWLSALTEASLSPEMLVNCGRLATASFGVVAIWLDPTRPSREIASVQTILFAYLAFSVLMLSVTDRLERGRPSLRGIIHAIDIATLCLLVLFSEALDSPFFVFFTFALITAALQWGMRGIFATALALQLLLAVSAWPDLQDGDSELNIFIMRTAYCWVSATMLGYFVTYRESMRSRLAQLAAWQPDGLEVQGGTNIGGSLDSALGILGGNRILFLWKAGDASSGFGLSGKPGEYDGVRRIDGKLIDDIVAIGESTILTRSNVVPRSLQHLLGDGMPPDQAGECPPRWRTICVTRLSSRRHIGALVVVDGSGQHGQLVSLAKIVTLRLACHLDQLADASERAEAAGLLEREELARDLHDGILQHLAAAALHLKVARSDLKMQNDRLDTVATILFEQQQQIRSFVEGGRAASKLRGEPLSSYLQRLAATLGDQWRCAVTVRVTPEWIELKDFLLADLCLLFSEAAANAVRHGHADRISWKAVAEGDELVVDIEDNGCGLPGGAIGHASPRSLNERIAKLGGALEILSNVSGLTLRMRLPLNEPVA